MTPFSKHELDLSRRTIRAQVAASLAVTRAARSNQDATLEEHIAVVEARLRMLESLVFAEIARIENAERMEFRTHGDHSAVDDEAPLMPAPANG